MRLLVDAQLLPALARWLASRGHQAEHVADIGLASSPDGAICAQALETGALIVTKDEDFAYRRIRSDEGPGITWVRLRNTRKAELLAWFGRALLEIEACVARGETIIELI